ncbi:acyl-CoA-binding domain-containing protein 5 [Bombina bombina]|uniref:acyl-CoA-binding domain-containing protein 5 n=1 Tax=Bombina bombina TaxID=8345 RepID=UPI00235A7773|nr:acyl-CoA-binding domain-containing protein 5 [Bombina bombina]XP_053569882.1 acyl-CoA-binding domain-containing protein 5 [Bombina bombina]
MADTKPLHQTRFEAAVNVIQSLPKNGSFQPSNEMMLKFYSFYKQATQGPCNAPRPGFWDPVGRYKWDAWSSLGDMSKEDAMIAYVDEMKKILETIPMTEKVEELLKVIGPFYEIVEDKKHGRGSGVTSDLSNALTSTPNCKAVNGKADSSDSGAESEEEETAGQEEEDGETEQSEQEGKRTEHNSAPEKCPDGIVANGLVCGFVSDKPNHIPTKSTLDETTEEEKVQSQGVDLNELEEEKEDDGPEDISAVQHLTSDSDSEIFCDSMEQFGHDEVDHSQLIQDAMLTDGYVAPLAGGEVKDGGEDGKPSGSRHQKEKAGNEKSEYFSSRRGRASRLLPVNEGSEGGQMGSSGDGERWGSDRGPSSYLNEQIAVILMRLQEDMQNVLQRLHKLETLTASQASSVLQESNYQHSSNKKPSWWPLGISPGTFAFAIIWPFVAHWLMHVYIQRRRRKPT